VPGPFEVATPTIGIDTHAMLILASQSPRRRELLSQIGLEFTVVPACIDETPAPGEAAEDYVQRMALEKAQSVADKQAAGDEAPVVVGSDTAVVLGDWIMGKPATQAEARDMLSALAGRSHRVLSSVAVVQGDKQDWQFSDNQVTFRGISEAEIQAYWESGEPRDKAGAYAIQGRGAVFVSHLSGSYSAVMGLPLFETAQLLAGFCIYPFSR